MNNASNRSLGRVGMSYGTAVNSGSSGSGYSSASTSSPRTYVDNSFNRSHGRVGMEIGSAVVSRSSGSGYSSASTSSPRTYVDNAYNRAQGRVGEPLGTAVVSRSSASSERSDKKTYVDNAYNRRLGRVGKEIGTHVVSTSSTTKKVDKVYVDNAMNRRLGRVGMPLGSMSQSATNFNKSKIVDGGPEAYREIHRRKQAAIEDGDMETAYMWGWLEGVKNRLQAKSNRIEESNRIKPEWLKSGEVIDYNADLEIGDKLGGGGFGDVYHAFWKSKSYYCCVKKLRVQRVHEKKRKEFQEEVKQFSSLNHPAIVKFFGACVETPNLAIVMEFMKEGSLYDAIILGTQFSDKTKFQLAEDMLSAIQYIHKLNMVHRDIKSSNVLLHYDVSKELHCKLADFGLALKEEIESSLSVADYTVVGTVKYSPFEVLEGEKLTLEQYKKVDVYSTALTIQELMTDRMAFDKMNQNQIRKAVRDGDNKDLDFIDNIYLKGLLARCLSKRASDRPSAELFTILFKESKIWNQL